MFTAVVLDENSQTLLRNLLRARYAGNVGKVFCHHVTLAMGNKVLDGYTQGERVEFLADALGEATGRAVAVRVVGVSRPDGKTPHVTLATFGEGKPKHSNEITQWETLPCALKLAGVVSVCD